MTQINTWAKWANQSLCLLFIQIVALITIILIIISSDQLEHMSAHHLKNHHKIKKNNLLQKINFHSFIEAKNERKKFV